MAELLAQSRKTHYYLAAAIMQAATSMGSFAAPVLAKREFDASAVALGALGAVSMGAYVVCTLPAGHLSDTIGRRKVILLAVLVLCGTCGMLSACPNLESLFFLVALAGVGQALFWPALEAAIADDTPGDMLPVRIGIFNIAWCTSVVVGTWISGRLCDVDPRSPFFWAALVAALTAPLVVGQPKPVNRWLSSQPLPCEDALAAGRGAKERQAFMRMAWCANFLSAGILNTFRSLFAPDALVRLRLSGEGAATLLAIMSVAQTIVFALLMAFHGWRYRFWFLALAQGCLIAGGVMVATGLSAVLLAVAFLVAGAGAGIIYTSSIYYSLEGVYGRGVKGGLHEAFGGAGASAVPMLAGTAASLAGDMRACYLVAAALMALGLAWELWTYLRGTPGDRREL